MTFVANNVATSTGRKHIVFVTPCTFLFELNHDSSKKSTPLSMYRLKSFIYQVCPVSFKMGVRRKLEDLKRFEHIAVVLSKYGFGMLVDKAHGSHSLKSKPEIRVRKAFEELGGAFVKLAQLLALRPDLVPVKYSEELEKLQDQGQPVSFKEIELVLKEQFRRPLDTVFHSIEQKPLAVGSIAQVHRATLTNGKKVVIKVLKPKTQEIFDEDIDLLEFLSAKVKKFVPSDIIDPQLIVKEFKIYTKKELDFSNELNHIHEFSKINIVMQTPHAYKELSSKKVLVMDEIKGVSLAKKQYVKWPKKIRSEVAKHLAISSMKQVFVHGLFHADPHPGNILVKDNHKLALIDFGIVGTVDTKTKVTLTILLYSLLYKDLKLLSRSLIKLGIGTEDVNREELEFDLKESLAQYYDADLSQVKLGDLFTQCIGIARKHKLMIPEKFILLGKAIGTTESVCHLLDPKFKFVVIAKPFLKNHLPTLISSQFMLAQAKEEIFDYGELVVNMPRDVKKLVSIKEDDHKSLEKLYESVNRLERNFFYLQKEMIVGILGIVLIIVALVTNTGPSVLYGLSITSTVLFCLGCLMMLSLMRFSHHQ